MKVIYKKTILDKLDEVIAEAKKQNKIIEKIELTNEEWAEVILSLNLKSFKVGKSFGSLFTHYKNVLLEVAI